MRYVLSAAAAIASLTLVPLASRAQVAAPPELSRSVAGGISVPGWMGRVDVNPQGQTIDSAKFAMDGKSIHVITGPAGTYWNPANKATGDYTVKATFLEPQYMNLNTHPHPYGIMIAGNDLGTDQQSYLYCSAYGNGTFIVRGFNGLTPFQVTADSAAHAPKPGARPPRPGAALDPDTSSAVHKAAGKGQPVTQDVAVSVKGNKVSCIINGTTVATFDRGALVTAGKLKSTDGVYGLRFAHNSEVIITGLTVTKN